MKLSAILSAEDVEFLDEYARRHGYRSRSAAVRAAVRMLRSVELGEAYAGAWADSGDDEPWKTATGDGFGVG